jgi:hypothetical protein
MKQDVGLELKISATSATERRKYKLFCIISVCSLFGTYTVYEKFPVQEFHQFYYCGAIIFFVSSALD